MSICYFYEASQCKDSRRTPYTFQDSVHTGGTGYDRSDTQNGAGVHRESRETKANNYLEEKITRIENGTGSGANRNRTLTKHCTGVQNMAKTILPRTKPQKVNATLICSAGCQHKLIWDTEHPASSYGLGVMRIARTNRIIDGASVLTDPGLRMIRFAYAMLWQYRIARKL